MEFTQEHLEKMWEIEQEILDVIHEVCCKHNIRYSLAYGTLIGAIRHKGFIPWDDDIDLMMPRDDYDKFKEAWFKENPKGYLLMDYHTHPENTNTFMKIVKDNTTFLQDERAKTLDFHKGIFVDIFPGDHVAPKGILRKMQYMACAVYLLYSRGYTSGAKGFSGFIEKVLLTVPRKYHYGIRVKLEKYIKKWNKVDCDEIFFPQRLLECHNYYSSNLFDVMELKMFNEKNYYVIQDWDTYLKVRYGDYMTLPPEEERIWQHHPLMVDFEHNYEDLLKNRKKP